MTAAAAAMVSCGLSDQCHAIRSQRLANPHQIVRIEMKEMRDGATSGSWELGIGSWELGRLPRTKGGLITYLP